ncbi:MAG: alanine:cation symporter family protein, partial [Erysipelotrichales bacterium]|nr:alanine:cation symporter family protein [Erysipelotrichales bacterium]
EFKDPTQLQIFTTSLGAVMGIGNIVGVATAILSGGPGSIFWMVISSLLITSLKYIEIYLGMVFRRRDGSGGTYVYMKEGIGSSWLSVLYLLCLLVACLTMGNLIVSSTLSEVFVQLYNIPVSLFGIGFTMIICVMVMRGQKGAMVLNSYLVPYMLVIYLVVCIGILVMYPGILWNTLVLIGKSAFDIRAVLGGGIGSAIKYGVTRGLFSNEAGMGSSTMIHARSHHTPHKEAMLGVVEVIIDSVVMCCLSGIVLVMSGIPVSLQNATLFLFEAFTVFLGPFAIPFITLSLLLFGTSSIIGWYVFGCECLRYVSRNQCTQVLFTIVFLGCIFLGSIGNVLELFLVSDILNGVLVILNMYACMKLIRFVRREY